VEQERTKYKGTKKKGKKKKSQTNTPMPVTSVATVEVALASDSPHGGGQPVHQRVAVVQPRTPASSLVLELSLQRRITSQGKNIYFSGIIFLPRE
jgi:hypothetical protein